MAELRIDQVLRDLDREVARAWEEKSRLGYFAALYRRVTQKVKEGILTPGVFQDPERMDRLDFAFASRYLDALAAFRRGDPLTRSWQVAFDAARSRRPVILQQLVLGINAHINLDLGIAAARTAPGGAIGALLGDFNRINEILAGLVTLVERQVGELSPWLGFFSRVAGEDGVRAIEFSMTVARDEAWQLAKALAPLAEPAQEPEIARRDGEVAWLARRVLHPGPLLDLVLLGVRAREAHDVRRVIDVLSQEVAHVTDLVERTAGRP
jgi:hypothetical protein